MINGEEEQERKQGRREGKEGGDEVAKKWKYNREEEA